MAVYEQYNEEALLAALSCSNHDAFTEIYNRYWKKLYYLAYKHLQHVALAEETVQDVFMNLWDKRAAIQITALPLYLAAMTRYAVYRQLALQNKAVATAIPEKAADMLHDAIGDRQLLQLVEKLAHRLPEKCRLVFIHNKLLDQPLAEVARQLGVSQKTAEAHLTKALKAIRGRLGDRLSAILFF